MTKATLFFLIGLAGCLTCITAGSAQEITGVSIHYVSSEWHTMPAENIINGNGLDTSVDPACHSNAPVDSYYWETQPWLGSAVIAFDLGGVYELGAIHVWNFNYVDQNGSYTGRGAKDVDILTSLDGSEWTSRGVHVFDIATGTADYTGQRISFETPLRGTRYVKFDIRNYYGGGDSAGHVGLSEVRFLEAVPEPGSIAVLVIGVSALIARGRPKR